jgi:hypothetical protein
MRFLKLKLLLLLSLSFQTVDSQTKKDSIKIAKPNAESVLFAGYTQSQKDSFLVMKYTKVTPCKYMTKKEMEVIQYLNVARMYPLWFIQFANLTNPETSYEISLVNKLKTMKTIPEPLLTDSIEWSNAKCHAISSGVEGYIGHDRRGNCKKTFFGECCDYGNEDALEIVKSLLIDEDIPSLGHRNICLDQSFKKIGVSIQPHKTYRVNAVLDFTY